MKKDKNKTNLDKEEETKKLEKEIEEQNKFLKDFGKDADSEKLRRSLSQLVVKDEYRILSDYEYKGIMERFKTRAETKTEG